MFMSLRLVLLGPSSGRPPNCCASSRFLTRFFSSRAAPTSTVTLGILRETYNTWERRTPLTPRQVEELLHNTSAGCSTPLPANGETRAKILKVHVERCNKRVFSDSSYQQAGAELVDTISDQADIILSVKRPQDAHTLLPNKTYAFFSHVIKGQEENMDILQSCLHKNIQLFDYEKILQPDGKRVVSFGRFAGLAGAIDTLHGLGVSFANQGIWTPFNVFPQTVYNTDLEDARNHVCKLSESIATKGIQNDEPIVFAVTGKGGAVHGGVMEILRMLPHEMVLPESLPDLLQQHRDSTTIQKKVYIVELATSDLFTRADGSFDRADFGQNPSQYRSIFPERVAPFAKVVVNCAYWDLRFPRILSKEDAKALHNEGNFRTALLSDISCDVNGSFEFLEKTTCIERPFFWYNPQSDSVSDNPIPGVLCLAVDILPTQLPKDSSEYFGKQLSPILNEMIASVSTKDGRRFVDTTQLSPGVQPACITTPFGRLSPDYRYLEQFLKVSSSESSRIDEQSMTLHISGHLFDSGLINEVVDAIVDRGGCNMSIEKVSVPESFTTPRKVVSDITLRVTSAQMKTLDMVEKDIRTQISIYEDAEATIFREIQKDPFGSRVSKGHNHQQLAYVTNNDLKKVVCLGSGYVASSAVQYLNKETTADILVVSEDEEGARRVAAKADVSSFIVRNVEDNPEELSNIVKNADIVLSLLPATMHGRVASQCLKHNTNLVTASYISDEIHEMGKLAEKQGLIFLNEAGLDPGLDHMSALKIIDSIQERGGHVSSFSSVCGGLPAPQSIEDANQLKYKFSWSPAGVLRASQQDAVYRRDGVVHLIDGQDLLKEARPFEEAWPELDLEVLPNRDSLKYENIYSLQNCATIFRGTLRYQGFCMFMNVFSKMGLLSSIPVNEKTWRELLLTLARNNGFVDLWDFLLYCSSGETDLAGQALILMNSLEITGDRRPGRGSIESAFCKVLERKLAYKTGEVDMVIMNHLITASFGDGSEEIHQSSMQLFGGPEDSAMAKSVGYTVGAAVCLVLEGNLDAFSGTRLPTHKEIYNPILSKVEQYGIHFEHTVTPSVKNENMTG